MRVKVACLKIALSLATILSRLANNLKEKKKDSSLVSLRQCKFRHGYEDLPPFDTVFELNVNKIAII